MEYPVNRKRIYGIVFFLFLWILLIFSAPVLYSVPDPALKKISTIIYTLFKPTCHQLPSRSLHLSGHALAVCTRCLSFYTAGLVISITYLFSRRIKSYSPVCYLLLMLPVLIDFILEKLNFYHNYPVLRFSTGFMAGLVLFHLLLLAINEKKVI
jgi:uncharacterized membrane protein